MTTRMVIENAQDSNPLQELVVVAHNCSNAGMHVLKPGDKVEIWVSSHSHVITTERQT